MLGAKMMNQYDTKRNAIKQYGHNVASVHVNEKQLLFQCTQQDDRRYVMKYAVFERFVISIEILDIELPKVACCMQN